MALQWNVSYPSTSIPYTQPEADECNGRYDKETGTGGSNGATMRFAPEGDHGTLEFDYLPALNTALILYKGANAGLKAARDFLEPVKQKFPWITYSDLWTLAGVASIQEMQGGPDSFIYRK